MVGFDDILIDFVNVFISGCTFFLAIALAFAIYCDMLLWIAFVLVLPMFLGVSYILREDIYNVRSVSKL